jgi:hypothetical protein
MLSSLDPAIDHSKVFQRKDSELDCLVASQCRVDDTLYYCSDLKKGIASVY